MVPLKNYPPKLIASHFYRDSGQRVPQTHEEILRVIYESLVMKYRYFLNLIIEISGKKVNKLHVLGGGSQNRLLNQFCANAMQIPVIAGPAEATSIGNAMVQLISIGEIRDHQEARKIITDSTSLNYFEPKEERIWNEQFERYEKDIIRKSVG